MDNVEYNEGGAGDVPKQSLRGEARNVQDQRNHKNKTLLDDVGNDEGHEDGGLLER